MRQTLWLLVPQDPLPCSAPFFLFILIRLMIFFDGGWGDVVSVFLSVFLFLLLDSLFPGRSVFSVSKCSTQKLYVLLLNSPERWHIQLSFGDDENG